MSLVLTQEGAVYLWQQWTGYVPPQPWRVHLLGASYTPLHTSKYSDYVQYELPQPPGGWYAPALLGSGSGWTFSDLVNGAAATADLLQWTVTSAATIYGYFISDYANQHALWAEQWPNPYPFNAGGGLFTLSVQPWLISAP